MAKQTKIQASIRAKCKRMVAIRLERTQKRKENQRPSKVKPDTFDSIAEKFINILLRKRIAASACSHYLIGGSNLHSFMLGVYNMKQAHAMFYTSAENKVTGQAGEDSFIRSHPSIKIKHPFGIFKCIPWLCATGDYVVQEFGTNVIVEIKTFEDVAKAKYFYNNIDQRAIIQLWIQLEVFGVNYGRIVVYYLDRNSKAIFRVGIINFEKRTTLFTKDFVILSAIRYIDFLREYFDRIKVYPSDNYFQTLCLRLAHNGLVSILNEKETSDNDYVRAIKRRLITTCQYLEDNSFHVGPNQNEVFVKYEQMFIGHKFVNRSRASKSVLLDKEFRQLFVNNVLNKINQVTRERIRSIESELTSNFVIKNFITSRKLKHIESLSQVRKKIALPCQSEQHTKYRFVIEKLKATIKTLRQEDIRLKHAIASNDKSFQPHENSARKQDGLDSNLPDRSINSHKKLSERFADKTSASIKTIRKNWKI